MSDILSRIRTFPSTPDGFDARTAPDHLLRKHGLPRRPDPVTEPELHRLWTRAFDRGLKFVQAEVEIDTARASRLRFPRPATDRTEFGVGDWAGASRERADGTDFSHPATYVSAEWQVPRVEQIDPDGRNNHIDVGFWVGIDGASEEMVLQGGVAGNVHAGWFSNEVRYYAWAEWFTSKYADPPIRFTNLPVSPGDLIACTVCAPDPGTGIIFMANMTRNHGSSIVIEAHPDRQLHGQHVEWIVEQASDALPIFSPVLFQQCVAGNDFGEVFRPRVGTAFDIRDANGVAITHAEVGADDTVSVEWRAFGKPGFDGPAQTAMASKA